MPLRPGFDVQRFNHFGREHFPGLVGLVITEVAEGILKGELVLRKALLAPNGYLHAGAIVTFADTLAGYGCIAHLPGNAQNFTTVELKANLPQYRRRRHAPRRGPRRSPGAHHPGLGRPRHPRRGAAQARAVPLHPAGSLSEVRARFSQSTVAPVARISGAQRAISLFM